MRGFLAEVSHIKRNSTLPLGFVQDSVEHIEQGHIMIHFHQVLVRELDIDMAERKWNVTAYIRHVALVCDSSIGVENLIDGQRCDVLRKNEL